MDVEVLDRNFRTKRILDDYISLIWTERYYEAGDFEIYMAPDIEFLDELLQEQMLGDIYFRIKDSDRVMMMDTIEITTDQDEGGRLKITGNSLEIMLDRRIYWEGFKMWEAQHLGSILYYCLEFNVTEPDDPNRKIPNFRFENHEYMWPPMYEGVFALTKEYLSETIYEIICEQCKYTKYGFKVLLTDDNHFDFILYKGVDRTPLGNENNYVIVSPKYDNLSESNYIRSNTNFKNVTLIEAKGMKENERIFKTKTRNNATYSGLNRREIYTDGRNISWKKENYTSANDKDGWLTNAEFQNLMFEAGLNTLSDHPVTIAFEGLIEPNVTYVYGKDYNLGDIVYIVDKYETEGKARITEVVKSYDSSGRDISFTLDEQDVLN